MSYTPTSSAGIAIAQLRRMVSLSATFQTAMGVASAAAAVAYILLGRQQFTSLPSAGANGGACVWYAETPIELQLQSGGDSLHLFPTGHLIVQLIYPLSSGDSTEDRYMKGIDFCGNVSADVTTLSGSADTESAFGENHLDVKNLAPEYMAPADVRHDASRGLLFFAKLHVDWGIV